MKITKKFKYYNDKRYSNPWVTKITSFNERLTVGSPTGVFNNRELTFNADAGEVVIVWLKDMQCGKTRSVFYKVEDDGKLSLIKEPSDARMKWIAFFENTK